MFDWYHKNRRFDVSLVSSINLNILLLLLGLINLLLLGYTNSTGSARAALELRLSGAGEKWRSFVFGFQVR